MSSWFWGNGWDGFGTDLSNASARGVASLGRGARNAVNNAAERGSDNWGRFRDAKFAQFSRTDDDDQGVDDTEPSDAAETGSDNWGRLSDATEERNDDDVERPE